MKKKNISKQSRENVPIISHEIEWRFDNFTLAGNYPFKSVKPRGKFPQNCFSWLVILYLINFWKLLWI
jgi:hypothetical protein